MTWICRLTRPAACSSSRSSRSASENPGLTNTPIGDVPGTISCRSPRRLASNDVPRMLTPVILPSGRLSLVTMPCTERIGGTDKDNWDWGGRLFCRFRRIGAAYGHDHRNLALNQIGHDPGQPIGLPLDRVIFDQDVLAFDIAYFPQAPAKRRFAARDVVG